MVQAGQCGRRKDRGGSRQPDEAPPAHLQRSIDCGAGQAEIRVDPNTDRASELGVSTEAIADAIRIATIGDVDANLAKYNAGDRLIPFACAC